MRRPRSRLAMDRSRALLKSHLEPALWQIHYKRIAGALGAIILRQFLTQAPNVHTDGGFLPWIERGGLRKNIETDGVFFETIGRSRKRLLGQIDEQAAMYLRSSKRLALEDALDLRMRRLHLKDHRYSDDTAEDLLRFFSPEMEQVFVVLETDVLFD